MSADFIDFLRDLKPGNMLLVQACIVVFVPYVLWRPLNLGRHFPLGVVQIFTGVLLGPAIFGACAPDLFEVLFSTHLQVGDKVVDRAAGISAVATIAACLFGFLAGADLDKQIITKSGPAIMSIGILGMLFAWLVAGLAGWGLYHWIPESHQPGTPAFTFAIAFGLVISVSALPILVIILRELQITRRRLGAVALASAGLGDTLLWLGLAIVVTLALAEGNTGQALLKAGLGGLAAVGFLRLIAAPVLNRLFDSGASEIAIMTMTAIAIFVSSAITAVTDLHEVLGAFVAGVLLPDRAREMAAHKFDQPTNLVLMPFFFLNAGLRTDFAYADATIWVLFGFSLLLCLATKMAGHGLAARLNGETWPFSLSVGLLLQTKGLVEIIVLSILLDSEVISQLTFSAAVLMCLVSTAMTTPALRLMFNVYGDALKDGDRRAVPAVAHAPIVTEGPSAAAAVAPEQVLAVLEFDEDLGRVEVTRPVITIGRHSEDDVQINDVRVSRHHARLQQTDGSAFEMFNLTADRSRANPVLVNGQEKEHAVLADGDRVSVGGAATFTFRPVSARPAGQTAGARAASAAE